MTRNHDEWNGPPNPDGRRAAAEAAPTPAWVARRIAARPSERPGAGSAGSGENAENFAPAQTLSEAHSEPLRALVPSAQSPLPGWLHWLESTAIPATPAVFGYSRPELHPLRAESEEDLSDAGSLPAETFAALLHDARSMVTALDLYCDLLDEPGVLTAAHRHYAAELRLVASSSRRLLAHLDEVAQATPSDAQAISALGPVDPAAQSTERLSAPAIQPGPRLVPSRSSRFALREPVASLADELMAMRNLLAALAGPAITLGLSLDGGYCPIRMASDDLTRLLVNLVRNAADAMPEGGHLQITLRETGKYLELSVSDTGCGLPEGDLEAIFAPGYTTHLDVSNDLENPSHRGMGLSIVRALVNSAGGRIHASNRPSFPADVEEESTTGAIFQLVFPLVE